MRFKIHSTTTAPEASRTTLAQIEKKYGFMPNFFGMLAESPASLQAYVGVSESLQHSVLTPIERQVVALTISVTTDCAYCVADHSTLAQMAGMPDQVLQELREQKPLTDGKLNALRSLVLSILYHRGWVPATDLEQYERAGYTGRHILEVITLLALKIMSNYANHVAKTPLDPQFAPHAWSSTTSATSVTSDESR